MLGTISAFAYRHRETKKKPVSRWPVAGSMNRINKFKLKFRSTEVRRINLLACIKQSDVKGGKLTDIKKLCEIIIAVKDSCKPVLISWQLYATT